FYMGNSPRGSFRANSKEVEHANRCGRSATQTEEGRNTKRFPKADRRTRHLTTERTNQRCWMQKKNSPRIAISRPWAASHPSCGRSAAFGPCCRARLDELHGLLLFVRHGLKPGLVTRKN